MSRTRHFDSRKSADADAAPRFESGTEYGRRLVWLWALLLFLCVALFPVVSDEFYWNLSRGRAVLEKHQAPSPALLAGATTSEADWLGGLPIFWLYHTTGLFGIMCAKLAVAAGMAALIFRMCRFPSNSMRILIVFVVMASVREGWDLTATTYDLLSILLLWLLLESKFIGFRRLCLLSVVFLIWANFGERPLLGILMLAWQGRVSTPPATPNAERIRSHAVLIVTALIASCLTPRGVLTIWDSFRLLLPRLVVDGGTLATTPWRMVSFLPLDPVVICFALISLSSGCVLILRGAAWGEVGAFLCAQVLGWTCRANLPVAALWTSLIGLRSFHSGTAPLHLGRSFESRRWLMRAAKTGACCVASVWAVSLAGGWWEASPWRLGWGLHPRLELQLCQLAFSETAVDRYGVVDGIPPSVHCPETRGAGMLAWLRPGILQPYDTPRHALFAGRLRENTLLNRDLAEQRTAYYLRADGSSGGWWLRLFGRHTKLLMIPNTSTGIIRGLEPVVWKQLSIDSPVIPYAIAGEPEVSHRLLRVVKDRHFLDRDVWSYTPPTESGEPYIDLWAPLTGHADPRMAVDQAAALRAMELWTAALRVVASQLRDQPTAAIQHEFQKCQQELAYREQLDMGRPSWLRGLAAGRPLKSLTTPVLPPFEPEQMTSSEKSQLQAALNLYRAGQPGAAAATLNFSSPDLLYAKAQLELEAGNSRRAYELLEQVLQTFPHSRIAIVASHALESFDITF